MFLTAGSTPDFTLRLLWEPFEDNTFGLGVTSASLKRSLGLGECVRSPLSLPLSPFASFLATRGVVVGEAKDCSSSERMAEDL